MPGVLNKDAGRFKFVNMFSNHKNNDVLYDTTGLLCVECVKTVYLFDFNN